MFVMSNYLCYAFVSLPITTVTWRWLLANGINGGEVSGRLDFPQLEHTDPFFAQIILYGLIFPIVFYCAILSVIIPPPPCILLEFGFVLPWDYINIFCSAASRAHVVSIATANFRFLQLSLFLLVNFSLTHLGATGGLPGRYLQCFGISRGASKLTHTSVYDHLS